MEDTEFDQVRTLLHSVEQPAGGLDAASVLGAGRRSEKHHRLTIAVTASGLTAVVLFGAMSAVTFARNDDRATPAAVASHRAPASPTAPSPTASSPTGDTTCTVQVLPAPAGGKYPMVSHADPTGHYAAGTASVGGADFPALWVNGVGHLLPLPKSLKNQGIQTNGVNSHGDVVGFAAFANGKTIPWLVRGGKATILPRLPGYVNADPTAINAHGDVVGAVWNPSGAQTPVIWPADRPGTVHRLTVPSNGNAAAYAIDSAGTIGGTIGDGHTPFAWDANGHGHALKVPSGYHGGKVFAVNGDWAVGYVGTSSESTGLTAARWNLTTGKVNVFDEQYEALSVSKAGDFVGGYSDLGDEGYLYRDGDFHPLPGTHDQADADPVGISDDGTRVLGQVVARLGDDPNGTTVPAIWHC